MLIYIHVPYIQNVKKMPDQMPGPLRVVSIPDVDVNTCCGTHLGKTSEMQVSTGR